MFLNWLKFLILYAWIHAEYMYLIWLEKYLLCNSVRIWCNRSLTQLIFEINKLYMKNFGSISCVLSNSNVKKSPRMCPLSGDCNTGVTIYVKCTRLLGTRFRLCARFQGEADIVANLRSAAGQVALMKMGITFR